MKKFAILLLFSALANTLGELILYCFVIQMRASINGLFVHCLFGVIAGLLMYSIFSPIIKRMDYKKHNAKEIYGSYIGGLLIGSFAARTISENFKMNLFSSDHHYFEYEWFFALIDMLIDEAYAWMIPYVFHIGYLGIAVFLLERLIKNLESDREKEAEIRNQKEVRNFTDDLKKASKGKLSMPHGTIKKDVVKQPYDSLGSIPSVFQDEAHHGNRTPQPADLDISEQNMEIIDLNSLFDSSAVKHNTTEG